VLLPHSIIYLDIVKGANTVYSEKTYSHDQHLNGSAPGIQKKRSVNLRFGLIDRDFGRGYLRGSSGNPIMLVSCRMSTKLLSEENRLFRRRPKLFFLS